MSEYEANLPLHLRHADLPAELDRIEHGRAAGDAAFIAGSEGDEGACVAVVAFDSATAILKKLFVRSSLRGQGIARALMEAALAWCRDAGFERIVLDTQRDDLVEAYALYESLGFRECAAYGPVDYANPTYMELSLR
ncbi:MAG: GNAT family N-acetyltransferase [Candidatus Eremiobacteraeota bacterium]|nr:GNAT family N-acetyltransferase [Candidatus Eremiobacteraeota bacterium]